MNTHNMVKQEFIKKWITTLHMLDSSVEHPTNITERKNAIRQSSDLAMAAARSGATVWSRALISRTGNKTTNKPVALRILKKARNRLKNRCTTVRRNGTKIGVRRRTELLKSLVPGGELIDDKEYLIRETLDYIVYLRAQVDVMRTVASVDLVTGDSPYRPRNK
ncbi:hypothetical protein EUTSA_v10014877mg [Eutrema salsugineum]|uniref:IBH1-like N-terminal domain-containing protein n=1 Tax=Eutrema salsugineum TaxID=72664 RepID=V4LRY8_EUTSA|nr:transcription factor IBH1-like 1 [Eutrema salsugineum]ESQ42623.1 hypothetical protein EUTSA_v10014877mg [Eutrema salsugineum]